MIKTQIEFTDLEFHRLKIILKNRIQNYNCQVSEMLLTKILDGVEK